MLLGFEWLAWVLRQHPRGLAGESGVATGQDRGAELFGEGAKREGDHPKPEAPVLAGARAEPLGVGFLIVQQLTVTFNPGGKRITKPCAVIRPEAPERDRGSIVHRIGFGFLFDVGDHHFVKSLRSELALAFVKLIAEPWDVGWGGYQLGRFPPGWAEWNDRYRDTVRSFGGAMRARSASSPSASPARATYSDTTAASRPPASISSTAHDGFTLHDLVSYNQRHNEANLEDNGDGHGDNLSWNCGTEGPTDDPAVDSLRRRQMRNLLATLFFSQGVPMLQAGDEFARTQRGNNNAYCQDNEISWVDWHLRAADSICCEFVQCSRSCAAGTSSSGARPSSRARPRGRPPRM